MFSEMEKSTGFKQLFSQIWVEIGEKYHFTAIKPQIIVLIFVNIQNFSYFS